MVAGCQLSLTVEHIDNVDCSGLITIRAVAKPNELLVLPLQCGGPRVIVKINSLNAVGMQAVSWQKGRAFVVCSPWPGTDGRSLEPLDTPTQIDQ